MEPRHSWSAGRDVRIQRWEVQFYIILVRAHHSYMEEAYGSGEGLGTNPSNSLIKLTVAVLTGGGVHPVAGRQHLKSAGPGQRPYPPSVERMRRRDERNYRKQCFH